MHAATIDSLINQAESLNLDDQFLFIDLFKKQTSERRREEIARNGEKTIQAINKNQAQIGSIDDFLNQLGNE